MENIKDILERYYQGESSVAEERLLRDAHRKGELPDDPALSFRGRDIELPIDLQENIRSGIRKKRTNHLRYICITAGGIAAIAVLIIMMRSFHPHKPQESVQLSDNIKIERLEEALRVIGNVLEETTTTNEKILYEDNNIVITIE